MDIEQLKYALAESKHGATRLWEAISALQPDILPVGSPILDKLMTDASALTMALTELHRGVEDSVQPSNEAQPVSTPAGIGEVVRLLAMQACLEAPLSNEAKQRLESFVEVGRSERPRGLRPKIGTMVLYTHVTGEVFPALVSFVHEDKAVYKGETVLDASVVDLHVFVRTDPDQLALSPFPQNVQLIRRVGYDSPPGEKSIYTYWTYRDLGPQSKF